MDNADTLAKAADWLNDRRAESFFEVIDEKEAYHQYALSMKATSDDDIHRGFIKAMRWIRQLHNELEGELRDKL